MVSNVIDVVCGISFNNCFKLLDGWGSIADDMLYGSKGKKYFGEKYYTNIGDNAFKKELYNPYTGNSLRVTQNSIIICHKINKDFKQEYKDIEDKVSEYIVPNIIKKNYLPIRRLGIVFTIGTKKDKTEKYITKIVNPQMKGINDIRYSKKEPTNAGALFGGREDYINKIFTIGDLGDGLHGISYDYQRYFIPADVGAGDKFSELFKSAYKSFEEDILEELGSL